jgi:isoquinoline 1-oxidoreductase alpha subunit
VENKPCNGTGHYTPKSIKLILQLIPRFMTLRINGKEQNVDADPSMPLLWVLRDVLNLTGTKYGCGVAACGACTVHVDGIVTRTCILPVSAVEGKEIKTIEAVGEVEMSAVQRAWIEHQVPQCGYCQSGMIMAAEALLKDVPDPSDEDINQRMTNICRCGTYQRIRAAIKTAAQYRKESSEIK